MQDHTKKHQEQQHYSAGQGNQHLSDPGGLYARCCSKSPINHYSAALLK